MTEFRVFTLAERPDLIDEADDLGGMGWPEFMLHDPVADLYFGRLYGSLADYQVVLVNADNRVIALGNTIPVIWDNTVEGLPLTGWDWAMEHGVQTYDRGLQPTTLCAVQAVIAADYQGQRLSQPLLKAMKSVAERHHLTAMIAAVRPNLKHRYPLTPMERYIEWKQPDGTLFDPWLRTHAKLGASIMRVAPQSMRIPGTVAEWEEWTEMRFPESGTYIVPGALVPVETDCENDVGLYIEPNVWMLHPVQA